MATNRKAGEPYTGHELVKSRLTKLVQAFPNGAAIYSHRIHQMAGTHVVIVPHPTLEGVHDWETFETFQDAKRSVILP